MQWTECPHFKVAEVTTQSLSPGRLGCAVVPIIVITDMLWYHDLKNSDAQREKFNQLYKIQDSGDFEETVIRLVEMVQNCLYIFGLFKLADVDGLLCNATEMGLDEFYTTFLSTKFQVTRTWRLTKNRRSFFSEHGSSIMTSFLFWLFCRGHWTTRTCWILMYWRECSARFPIFEENSSIS